MLEKWYIYYDLERVRVKSERDAVLISLETDGWPMADLVPIRAGRVRHYAGLLVSRRWF